MYSFIIPHLYTVLCVRHPGLLPPPFEFSTYCHCFCLVWVLLQKFRGPDSQLGWGEGCDAVVGPGCQGTLACIRGLGTGEWEARAGRGMASGLH